MLWGGRFSGEPKKKAIEFNSAENISVDGRLVEYDVQGSIAHVKMLAKQKILPESEADEIVSALESILADYKAGKFVLDPALEDVHMNVETEVTRRTPLGKKMHVARSRNDQINLDMRLYLRAEVREIIRLLQGMRKALRVQGKTVVTIPGHTHTRVAQPMTNAFWGEAYSVSFGKDVERLEQVLARINKNPLGACALAGTSWDIDREYTAKLLGFDGVEENELETISSRGELESEVAFACSLVSAQLSRIAEDLIWLSYVGLADLPEAYSTGSSIMPNKMNPDVLELVRGRTGRVYGNLVALLTVLKGTPTGHNADSQEGKRLVMDSVETVKACLDVSADIVAELKWNGEVGEQLIRSGFARATQLADALAKEGVPFREAHERVGKLVKKLKSRGKAIEDLSAAELKREL